MTTEPSAGRTFPAKPVMVLAAAAVVVLAIYLGLGGCKPRITVLGEDIPSTHAIEQLAKQYEAQPDANVRIRVVKDAYETMVQKANTDLSAGTGVYDIILSYNTALSSYTRNRYVFTFDETKELMGRDAFPFEGDLFEPTWKEVGWYWIDSKQKPVAIPFSANTMLLCYNKELFGDKAKQDAYQAEYGRPLQPPTDWDEFLDIAEFFTNPEEGTFGLCLQGSSYFIYYEWANFAFGQGGGVMKKNWGWQSDENTPLLLTTQPTIDATEFYISLEKYNVKGGASDDYDYLSTDAIRQRERMTKRDVAMCIMWSDVAFGLVENINSSDIFGFAVIPGDKSMLAGGSYYINRKSKHPVKSIEFIISQLSLENQVTAMKRGLCSPLRSAYEDPGVLEEVPYAAALKESLDRGVYMLEAGPDSDAIIVILSDMLQRMWREGGDVAGALEEVERDIEAKRREIYRQISQ